MDTQTHYEQMSPAEQARVDAQITRLEWLIREWRESHEPPRLPMFFKRQAE
jgi:hypothetical protein